MIRSSFKRPTLQRVRTVHKPIPPEQRRGAAMCVSSAEPAQAIPKENALEHEGYRRLVAAFNCIHCGKADRSQHAHENEQKGKGLKLDDRRAMPLCADEPGLEGCHTKFDQYRLLPGGREAHVEQGRIWSRITRAAVEASGLWPKNLPKWTPK